MTHVTETELREADLTEAEEFSFRPTCPHVAFADWQRVLDAGGGPCLALGAERRTRKR